MESLNEGIIERCYGLYESHRQDAVLALMCINNEEKSKHCYACIHVYPFGISGPSAQEVCDIIRSELREQTSQILTVLDPPDPVALILDS